MLAKEIRNLATDEPYSGIERGELRKGIQDARAGHAPPGLPELRARGWPSRPGGVVAVPAGIPQPLHLALHYFCRQSRTPVSANTRRPSR